MNDENINPISLQEKYELYKKSQNNKQICQNHTQGESVKTSNEIVQFVKAQSNSQNVMQMLLGDPTLRQLSQNLKKRAQEQHRQLLISSFPERYQGLLQKQKVLLVTEEKVQKLQLDSKQKIQKLRQKIEYKQKVIREKEEQIQAQNRQKQRIERKMENELSDLLGKKQKQNNFMREQMQLLENRCEKYKTQYSNACKVIVQLRDQEQNNEKEQKRLITTNRETEERVGVLQRKIKQGQQQYKIRHNSLELQLQSAKNENVYLRQQVLRVRQDSKRQLQYRVSLIEQMQGERQQMLVKHQQYEKQKHQQIQSIRLQYLQALQTIDVLQEKNQQVYNKKYQVQMLYEEQSNQKEQLQTQNTKLKHKIQRMCMQCEQLRSRMMEMDERCVRERGELENSIGCGQKERVKMMMRNEELMKQKMEMHNRIKEVQDKNKEDFDKISLYVKESIQKTNTHINQYKQENRQLKEAVEQVKEQKMQVMQQNRLLRERVQLCDREVNRNDGYEQVLNEFMQFYQHKMEMHQENYVSIKENLQQWVNNKQQQQQHMQQVSRVQRIRNQEMGQIKKNRDNELQVKYRKSEEKVQKLTAIIQKLKQETQRQCNIYEQQSFKDRKMFEDMVRENRMLKKQLHSYIY